MTAKINFIDQLRQVCPIINILTKANLRITGNICDKNPDQITQRTT